MTIWRHQCTAQWTIQNGQKWPLPRSKNAYKYQHQDRQRNNISKKSTNFANISTSKTSSASSTISCGTINHHRRLLRKHRKGRRQNDEYYETTYIMRHWIVVREIPTTDILPHWRQYAARMSLSEFSSAQSISLPQTCKQESRVSIGAKKTTLHRKAHVKLCIRSHANRSRTASDDICITSKRDGSIKNCLHSNSERMIR